MCYAQGKIPPTLRTSLRLFLAGVIGFPIRSGMTKNEVIICPSKIKNLKKLAL